MTTDLEIPDFDPTGLLERLGDKTIVFVGMMGAGKTAVGRRAASALGLPFVDSDQEIEKVSRMTVSELFQRYGEPEFRALEARVIHRLLEAGRQVVSTGGGAFMNPDTRAAIAERGVSVWLSADVETLLGRIAKKHDRPLLQGPDPRGVLERLLVEREPFYSKADVTIRTRDDRKETIAAEALAGIARHLSVAQTAAAC